MKKLIIAFTLLIVFQSCRKDVSETHHNFVGYWVGVDIDGDFKGQSLYILNDGYSEYINNAESYGETETIKKKGRAIVKNGNLKIGRFYKMKINKYPSQDTFGRWTMVLDEKIFLKD